MIKMGQQSFSLKKKLEYIQLFKENLQNGSSLCEVSEKYSLARQTVTEWLKKEQMQIRTGRATPALLDGVRVEAYGSKNRKSVV